MSPNSRRTSLEPLRALPGDAARRIMWRFADRDDVQRLVGSVRSVARGEVARLVAGGARRTAAWTPEKDALLAAYDRAGVTTVSVDRADGGVVEGPKSLALALTGFELAWVDAGAASIGLAQHLALAPIRDRGTEAQRRHYLRRAAGIDGQAPLRGAFCLTEPLPNVGAETGLLGGSLRIAEWREGEEPVLQVDKRGRFITNMAFADFVVVAVRSADPRIKGSCMVVVERDDPGTFDPQFWLDYFKRTRSDAVCLSAGGCVAYYPTHIQWQLYQGPWTEFAILQLQVLSGSDRFASLVQWACMLGSTLGVSLMGALWRI